MTDDVAGPDDPPEEHEGVSSGAIDPRFDKREVEYTYEHVDELPETDADIFRVVGVNDYTERPTHKNVYFVPGDGLNAFLEGYSKSGERYVDIRPVTQEQARRELDAYRDGG